MAYTNIDRPDLYFNTKLYTGNGSTQSINGVNFRPDWVWIKNRSITADHKEFDVVRGVTNALIPNSTAAEFSQSGLDSFDSDGFTVGSHVGCNGNGNSLVAWNWLASNTTASNTDGSITSTVSANTTSGFSIVSYTGTGSAGTVGHGLNSNLSMVIIKNRSAPAGDNWEVYHSSVITSDNQSLNLDNTNAVFTRGTASWDISEFNSNVIGLNTNSAVNTSSATYIAYCFAEKKGFSKFGSYTGNGSSDGTFVYTGFKPAFFITKSATSAEHWYMNDSKRSLNGADKKLFPNLNVAESSEVNSDILSNGFKLRSSNAINNSSGQTYIYMAFAENPFVTSTGIPTCAR
jgi:hypothetical protein